MVWTKRSTRVAGICLALLALTLFGCGTIGEIIVGSIVSSQELSEVDSFCTKRCADLKGDDKTRCYRLCMSEERERRWKIKAEGKREREKIERRLAEDALRSQRK